MKKITYILFLLFSPLIAQTNSGYFSAENFYGFAIEHDKKLAETIEGNPYGFILSYDKKHVEDENWVRSYNYPDNGFSFIYEDFNGEILGKVYSALRHHNFYLNDRNNSNHFLFKVGFGLGYVENPYEKVSNPNNHAIGSNLVISGILQLNYQKEFLKNKFGLKAGASLIHYSNASYKNPNLGINTIALNLGVNYNLDESPIFFSEKQETVIETNPIEYNFLFRFGYNQSLIVESDLYPFYIFSFYGAKKINYKSTYTAGTDFYISKFLKYHIDYVNQIYNRNSNADYKRVGIFVGHELYINHFSFISQIGYNVYYPYKYISRVYERFGFKHKLNSHLFTELTLKVNLFRAEALEFGIGYRF